MTRRRFIAALPAALNQGRILTSAVSSLELDLLHGAEKIAWTDVARPITFGSLLKPFLALAFAKTHSRFPTLRCRGAGDRCWLPQGHGKQDIVAALANSCNCYFLSLANGIDRAALDEISLSYELALPSRSLDAAGLIGLGPGWFNSPLAVARAFAQLGQNRSLRAGISQAVLTGMERCAAYGTARNVHLPCYAKTGTAPCSHLPRATGDGFVAVIYPRDQPRLVLLLQRHGTTGAEACRDVRGRIDLP